MASRGHLPAEKYLPACRGQRVFPVQAFWDGRRAYGLQFHPEVNFRTVRRWLMRDREEDRRLQRPGARPYWSHLTEYVLHHRAMVDWFNKFLDVWLHPQETKR